MTYYDDIYEIAADNYGIVTTSQANAIGATNKDLLRYVNDGRLTRLGRGVYRVKYWVPTEYDPYAVAVALVGKGAYLYGESVLAMHELAPTNPSRIDVAMTRRVRKRMPGTIRLRRERDNDEVVEYEGIPSQSVLGAIRSCKGAIMSERLADAARSARRKGLICEVEEREILEELETA